MPGLKSLAIGFRSLRRRPHLTVVSVLTLGLGIGAGAAIYAVLQATLLSPPPYTNPDRLVAVWGVMPTRDIDEFPAAPPQLEIYRRETRLFEDLAGYSGNGHVLRTEEGKPEQVNSMVQTWNLFQLLGVKPLLGRDFSPEDARFNQSEVPAGTQPPNNVFNPAKGVILSHAYWRDRFGSDPEVIQSRIYVDELPVTIIGVMPPDFRVLLHGAGVAPDMFEVLRVDNENASLVNVFLNVIGRLGAGISLEQAEADINAVNERIKEREPIYKTNQFRLRLVGLQDELTRDIRAVVWVLAGAVAFILLIACANVSNLLLARAAERRADQCIQVALGCSRWRLVVDSLLETGLLALAGAGLGVAVAYAAVPVLVSLQPQNIPQLSGLEIDLSVLGFAALTAVFVTLLAGSLPALTAGGRSGMSLLTVRGVSGENVAGKRYRSALILGEVALSFVLLVAAGLMARSFYELHQIDPGFEPEGVLTFTYNFPAARFPNPESQLDFHRRFEERVEALPGVEAMGGIFPLPLTGGNFGSRYSADLPSFTDGSARQAQYRSVYPGYFEAVQSPLVTGRFIDEQDQRIAARVVVINEAIAERTWAGRNPVGERLYIRGATPDPIELEVIGVVRNQKQQTLDENAVETLYAPNSLFSEIGFGTGTFWTVRVEGDPHRAASAIEPVLRDLDAEMPMQFVQTLQEIVDQSAAPTRFAMTLIGVFSAIATLLAAVGLYGVLVYRVRRQVPELGIRLTFGATRARIFRMVLANGLLLAALGVGIGFFAALGLTRTLSSMLVGVTPADPLTYAMIAILFGLIAAVSCLLPAYRATRIDPARVLRQE